MRDTAPGAPLKFASLNGPFPAQPLLVEKYQDTHNFAATVQRFIKSRGFYTPPLSGFPATVAEERTWPGSRCCKAMRHTGEKGVEKLKEGVASILEYIRLVLQHEKATRPGPGPAKAKVSDPCIFLRFCARDVENFQALYYLVPVAEKLNETFFNAVFFKMISQNETTVGVDGTFPPTVFSFARGQLMSGVSWPHIE